MTNQVTFFRPRRLGPEQQIEDSVVSNISNIFSDKPINRWAGGSVPIGAGMPDLVIAYYKPELFVLPSFEPMMSRIVSYIRTVGACDPVSLSQGIGISETRIHRHLDFLLGQRVIVTNSTRLKLSRAWLRILPEIISIEAKVSDWQKAVRQAKRNRIFSHRSMIALPDRTAARVINQPMFANSGLGLLAVSDSGNVRVLKRGKRTVPLIWNYYYHLAYLVANNPI
jgi:hypothetical protein